MTDEQERLLNQWCYNHNLTYFVDSKDRLCLCNVNWINIFDTDKELFDYIKKAQLVEAKEL